MNVAAMSPPKTFNTGRLVTLVAVVAVIGLVLALLMSDRVTQRERQQEIDMVEIEDPPEPEPEPEPEPKPAEPQRVVERELPPSPKLEQLERQLDPRPQATRDLSLVGESDNATDAFQLGAASSGRGIGQGGSGGNARYGSLVKTDIHSHLRHYEDIAYETFEFEVTVRVLADARVEILSIRNVQPPALQAEIESALRQMDFVSRPPPRGVNNIVRLKFRQTA